MNTARHLLADKQIHDIISISPQATVYQALQLMAEKNIGAVLVMEGKHLVGIFSERDYARKVVLQGKTSAGTPVADIMTRQLMVIPPDTDIDTCLALMTEKRIRHLPVLNGDEVRGILSIGDLVRAKIADQQYTIEQLSQYIYGIR
ncbi:CBS domain-containing protein [Chitiniphilus eburneus]|uniref:CBS domain-containing protein n=1 Tax=Chitiniphilus eburneus TaxID=2571148 RepID=A0A4U0PTE2_9NEIS|nr:CBS domain-containing protein [Chitiniphilus eburneus]TJZ71693.1 CBS domain-containing protein [Chitiniphilus eburneus]